jgi:hypothetical protein
MMTDNLPELIDFRAQYNAEVHVQNCATLDCDRDSGQDEPECATLSPLEQQKYGRGFISANAPTRDE